MVLNIHSDTSYLTASKGRSRAGGYSFLGSLPREGTPIKLNGNIAITCAILKLVAASAAEAELGALFLNVQEAKVIRLILQELGHPQPPSPIHINNTTAVGIVNNTIKRQRSRSMEMCYFYLLDQQTQKYFKFYYQPGQENMADYPSKHHTAPIHQHVRPYYLHMPNSPQFLVRAAKPSARQGCAQTLADPYHKRVPLPRIPDYRTQDKDFTPTHVESATNQHTRSSLRSQRTSRIAKRHNTLLDKHTKMMSTRIPNQ